MLRLGFDEASIVASTVPPIWSIVPPSTLKVILPLHDLCSYLRATPDMEHSPIEELIIRKEEGDVQHEFLLILLHKPSGGKFWMRLDRKGPEGGSHGVVSGFLEARDIVSALIDN